MFAVKNPQKLVAYLLASTIIVMALTVYSRGQQTRKITGTYTNMHFNKEGGDLLGQELKIVLSRKGYEGCLQFAEGGAGSLIVVSIRVDTDKISFSIPESYGEAGEFSGTIRDGVLRGVFKFNSGGDETVELKKGKSYWD